MKKKCLLSLAIVLLIAFPSLAQWDQTASPNGGVTGNIELIGNTIFIAAYNSGIYQSSDNGVSWVKSKNGLPSKASAQAIYADQGKLYASIHQGGIYCTADTGKTWVAINKGIEYVTCYSVFANGNEILAGNANGGAFYSPNGGQSWFIPEGITNKDNVASQISDFAFFDSKFYAACKDKLYELTEDRANWIERSVRGLNSVHTLLTVDSLLYIAGDGPVYQATHSISSIKPLALNSWATITNIKSLENKVYLTTSAGRIFYTEDNGKGWNLTQNTNIESFANDALMMSSGKILMSCNQGLYSSIDNGESWSNSSKGLNALEIESLHYSDSTLLAGSYQGGLYRSADFGSSWQAVSINSTIINGIIGTDEGHFAGCENGLFKSTDRGITWSKIFDPGTNNGINCGINALNKDEKSIVLAVNSKGIYRSQDNGVTWKYPANNGLTPSSYKCVELTGDTIFLADVAGGIEVSIDGGDSWIHRSYNGSDLYTMKISYTEGKLFAATVKGLVYSEDLGFTWSYLLNDTRPIKDFIFNNDKIILATDDGVLISKFDEDRWFTLGQELEDVIAQNIVLRDSQLFAGTFSEGIWKMESWEINAVPVIIGTSISPDSTLGSDSISINLEDLIFDDLETDTSSYEVIIDPGANYIVGSDNTLKSANNYTGTIQVPIAIKDSNVESKRYVLKLSFQNGQLTSKPTNSLSDEFKVYPVPASELIHYNISNSHLGPVEIRIIRMDGRVALSLSENKNSEQYRSTIDISQLSRGLYVLNVSFGNKELKQKFWIK